MYKFTVSQPIRIVYFFRGCDLVKVSITDTSFAEVFRDTNVKWCPGFRVLALGSWLNARPCDFNENVPDGEGGEMALKRLKIRDIGESNRQLR